MTSRCKPILCPLFLGMAIFFCVNASAGSKASKPNGGVISIGGTLITKSRIDTLTRFMAKSQGIEDPAKIKSLEKLIATNLIGQELLEKEAKKLLIDATPKEMDSAVKIFKANFPDDASFRKALLEAGDTETKLKEKISRQIRADKTLSRVSKKPELPNEKEMLDFWGKNQKSFPINDSLRALQIVLQADAKMPIATANQLKQKLESIRQELATDTIAPILVRKFMNYAAKLSDGPEGKVGGDLQRFHPNDFNPEFRKQIINLQVGVLSPVFRTPLGFHLILLIEKYDGKYNSYKMQIMQNLIAQKTAQSGEEIRVFLKGLAMKYPVKFIDTSYQDKSEAGLYL